MNLLDLLQTIVSFIVVLGILITVHEFGHFWVARRAGVKVLRFSVGFGKPLWSKISSKDDTEFVIAAIPLGGYVRMLDEREGEVDPSELDRAFNRQSLPKRFAVVAAGPIFNFLLAIVAYWAMYVIGVPGLTPIVGSVEPESPAGRAGMMVGQQIISVDGQNTGTWESVAHLGLQKLVADGWLKIKVNDGGLVRELDIDLTGISLDDVVAVGLFEQIGMQPARPSLPAVIDDVLADGAAEAAGIRSGDRIVSADGALIDDWMHWVDYVRARPDKKIQVEVERDGGRTGLLVVPARLESESGEVIGRIGASVMVPDSFGENYRSTERYSVIGGFLRAVTRTGEVSILTLRVMGKIITGNASVKNLSGPISIAQYAGRSAEIGLTAFLGFLAIVSISLGVLNLLPIPLLDGGHLMYYLIELFRGSPVSEVAQARAQHFGIAVLLGLMGLAIYNDLARLLG